MKQIPTAKEFLNKGLEESGFDLHGDQLKIFKRKMIEFAKLHVEAQAKEIAEKAELYILKKAQYSKTPRWKKISKQEEQEGVDLFRYETQTKISKKSILNAYPLTNIK